LSLFVCAAPAQAQAVDPGGEITPMQVLRMTAAQYKQCSSYELQVTVQNIRGAQVSEKTRTESGVRGEGFRVEDTGDAAPNGELRVANKTDEWVLNRATGEYTRTPLTAASPTPLTDFENIDQNVTGAEFAREDMYGVNGELVRVVVVHVARSQWPKGLPDAIEMASYQIDERNLHVLHASYIGRKETKMLMYSIAKWNAPVETSQFAFTPPASSHEVASLTQPTAAFRPIVGAAAPDFTLKDPAGSEVNLHALLGKVVVVDFWASWCGPCRESMPELQSIHQQMEKDGVAVLGLNGGETAETVAAFAKETGYTFPLLLGTEPEVAAKYFVEAYPTTIVIGRDGRIAYQSSGFAGPGRVRAAVEAALKK
jgi:peroxiredoxin